MRSEGRQVLNEEFAIWILDAGTWFWDTSGWKPEHSKLKRKGKKITRLL
jgi:hypothetical protein